MTPGFFVYYIIQYSIMRVEQLSNNIHKIYLKGKTAQVAILSDLHWDNPKCNRDLLKKHLDYCINQNIPIVIIGDMFCLMQGRGDNRRNKSDIRPEHNNTRYLDSIVETAVDWFTPYAHLIAVIGYGNHETGIIKYQETDILERFVTMLNFKSGSNVYTGGYGGWLIYNIEYRQGRHTNIMHKYFHGSGGGGIVTKGAINLTRALEMYEGMDIFSIGHIHENASRIDVRESLEENNKCIKIVHKEIHHCITGTYKEEYGDGSKGWHIERGAPPKPLGGRVLKLAIKRHHNDMEPLIKKIDSHQFPLFD